VNITNRANKAAKFRFETSEDAVMWTVFNGLQQAGTLAAVVPHEPEGPAAAGGALEDAEADVVRVEVVRHP
jgi:hypothetical protein